MLFAMNPIEFSRRTQNVCLVNGPVSRPAGWSAWLVRESFDQFYSNIVRRAWPSQPVVYCRRLSARLSHRGSPPTCRSLAFTRTFAFSIGQCTVGVSGSRSSSTIVKRTIVCGSLSYPSHRSRRYLFSLSLSSLLSLLFALQLTSGSSERSDPFRCRSCRQTHSRRRAF